MKFIVYNSIAYEAPRRKNQKRKIIPENTPHYVVSCSEDAYNIKRMGRGNHNLVMFPTCLLNVVNRKGDYVKLENSATWDYIIANSKL